MFRLVALPLMVSAVVWSALADSVPAAPSGAGDHGPFFKDALDRPLRYTPDGTDFVITNGAEFFNRPLYGGSSPFRVDGGDEPEFSLYLPGRGGNLRFGIRTAAGVKWLNRAAEVVARYRPGSLVHEVRDPLLGGGLLRLTTLAPSAMEGLIVRAELSGTPTATELIWAFGGVNGLKGRRDGDIGCETEPVGKFFQLHPGQCAGNRVTITGSGFQVQGKPGTIDGVFSAAATLAVGDAARWDDPAGLFSAPDPKALQPLLTGCAPLPPAGQVYLFLQRLTAGKDADETPADYREVAAGSPAGKVPGRAGRQVSPSDLPRIFAAAEDHRRAIAERVMVLTPDPFINASAAALNVAADAVWDDRQEAYLHGGVAWRVRLLGWRVSYAGDELGWHDRTAKHFEGYARQQNISPVPDAIAPADEGANLSRDEAALHSNGDLSKSHYDMNLVSVDAFFRHLLWTGDLEYARRLWPVIERHLAWERRLFRREFGPEKLPLYEAYCCIWASDDLEYNGGGVTHSSAYNLFHNRLAARVARLLGKDASPYENEADMIAWGMRRELWLPDFGWFAEWKDWLGLQLVHPNAALWTFYHTVDSEVPTPLEAWQMSRFVDTQIAHIPLRGAGVPIGNFTLPTTSWMPYTWSLNNVVMAESTHTALAYWQANRPDEAYALFKGAMLDSMFLGICPGNVGMCTYFDANRRESQRDFGDGSGATSRALVEGLFGVQPDLLAGVIKIHPGFPASWNDARIRHPDFNLDFERKGLRETFSVEIKFAHPLKLRLQVPALRDEMASVTVNGQPAAWHGLEDSVGVPRIEIETAPARQQNVVIEWRGKNPSPTPAEFAVAGQAEVRRELDAKIMEMADPQNALREVKFAGRSFQGVASGQPGHRTVFAKVEQGGLRWWQPVTFEILAAPATETFVWNNPVRGKLEMVKLDSFFNERVTQIFRNEYRSPRSSFCSLAAPKQGIGSWCHPQDQFAVDDSGLRAEAAKAGGKIILPDGVPLATPGAAAARNIAFVSQWENYPREITVPLKGRAARAFLLLAGSTGPMESRFDNGEVVVSYTDGSIARLALHNPTTWWPIDQDYYLDDFAFARPEPLPVRINLKTGLVRVLDFDSFKGKGRVVPGGAATVLDLPLDVRKEMKSLTVSALANEVVIGLMSVTLQR